MIDVVTLAINEVLWYANRFIQFITGSSNAQRWFLFFLLVGVGFSVLWLGFKVIRSFLNF